MRDLRLALIAGFVGGLTTLLSFPWLFEFLKAYGQFVHGLFGP
jgi:fluoride ion exporter CrcB/FEX